MKIIHVITTISRGGAETQLLTLVREQVNADKDVSVVYLKGEPELLREFELVGAKVDSSLTKYNPVIQLFKLRRAFPRTGAIIHAHLPRAEILCALARKKNYLFLSKHNAEQFFPNAPASFSKKLSHFVNSKCHGTICISKAVKNFLVSISEISDDPSTIVIYYGFNPNVLVHPKRVIAKENELILGTISRLALQKDLPTLIRAFRKISDEINVASLIIVGRGSERESLIELSRDLNVEKRITWIEKSENVFRELEQMNIFLLSSRYEGFGLVLLEAMQSGTPVVAPRNSAIPEVLGERYPYLFETGNELDLFNKILSLREPANYESAQEYLKERLQNFSPVVMERRIANFYAQTLHSTRGYESL